MEPRQFIAGSLRLPTLRRMSPTRAIAHPCLRALRMLAATISLGGAAAPVLAQAPEVAAQELRFDVLEYVVEGNSVLGVTAIEAAVLPHMGPQRSMADVEAARAALEKAYQGAGYLTVFVDVPEQRVDSGVVTLRVLEGRVERLMVSGSRYFSQGYIRSRVAELAEGQVPNFNVAQAQLGEVNRTDERRVQPLLRPGRTPGTVEIELKVTDELPLEATVELNNRHAADTTPWRLQGTLRYANLWQRDHALAVTAITAPAEPKESKVLSMTYTVPLPAQRTLVGYLVASDSTLEPLGAATVFGKGITAGLRWVHPLAVAPSQGSHSVTLGADYKNLRERIESAGVDALSTPLRYLPFMAAYSGLWQEGAEQTQLNLTGSFGLRRLLQRDVACPGNIGPVDQFACKRQGADGGFSTLRLDWRHNRPAPWIGGALLLRLGGQVASQPVPSSEQFTAGGAETVRGYLEGEGSGDHGLLGSLEWRSGNLMGAPEAGESPLLNNLNVIGFVDVARLYTLLPSAGQAARTPLAGTGLGLRAQAWRRWNAELDLAWPLKATSRSPDRDVRVHARLVGTF